MDFMQKHLQDTLMKFSHSQLSTQVRPCIKQQIYASTQYEASFIPKKKKKCCHDLFKEERYENRQGIVSVSQHL